MGRIYTPTEEEVTKLPIGKTCTTCNVPKDRGSFGFVFVKRTKNPYWTLRASCRACEAIHKRNQVDKASERRIFAQIAPMSAAKKLLEQNPEALALLIQRFRPEYVKLLEEERQRLLNIKKTRVEAVSSRVKHIRGAEETS